MSSLHRGCNESTNYSMHLCNWRSEMRHLCHLCWAAFQCEFTFQLIVCAFRSHITATHYLDNKRSVDNICRNITDMIGMLNNMNNFVAIVEIPTHKLPF